MMSNSNQMTKEAFLKSIIHPRKKQLAELIFAGTSNEEIEAASFDKSRIQEMKMQIARNVQGMESLSRLPKSAHNIQMEGDVPGRALRTEVPVAPTVPEVTPETIVVPPVETTVTPEATTVENQVVATPEPTPEIVVDAVTEQISVPEATIEQTNTPEANPTV